MDGELLATDTARFATLKKLVDTELARRVMALEKKAEDGGRRTEGGSREMLNNAQRSTFNAQL